MEAIMNHAEEVLRQHAAPAMTLIELHRCLRERRPAHAPSCASLRVLMDNCPDRFRIVDPWRRPWLGAREERGGEAVDVVVMAITRGSPNDGHLAPSERLRESVRWIARAVDLRSPGNVARLYALLLAVDGARPLLRQRAA